MKKFISTIAALIAMLFYCEAQNTSSLAKPGKTSKHDFANRSLSNLIVPTSVNVNLLPETDATKNLGSSVKKWKDLYLSGSLYTNFVVVDDGVGQNGYLVHRRAGIEKWVEGTIGNDNFSVRNWVLGSNALTIDITKNNVGIGTETPGNRLVVTDNTTVGPTAIIQNLFHSPNFNDGLYILAGNNEGTGGSWYTAFVRPDGLVIA